MSEYADVLREHLPQHPSMNSQHPLPSTIEFKSMLGRPLSLDELMTYLEEGLSAVMIGAKDTPLTHLPKGPIRLNLHWPGYGHFTMDVKKVDPATCTRVRLACRIAEEIFNYYRLVQLGCPETPRFKWRIDDRMDPNQIFLTSLWEIAPGAFRAELEIENAPQNVPDLPQ